MMSTDSQERASVIQDYCMLRVQLNSLSGLASESLTLSELQAICSAEINAWALTGDFRIISQLLASFEFTTGGRDARNALYHSLFEFIG